MLEYNLRGVFALAGWRNARLGATSFLVVRVVRPSLKGHAHSLKAAMSASVWHEVACRRLPVTPSKPKREITSWYRR